MIINTPRLRLRSWQESHRNAFADMHSHLEVMHDYCGVLNRAESDEKLDRYIATYEQHGYCREAVRTSGERVVIETTVMPVSSSHPLGAHLDIGWRLVRSAWGQGYATEAARAALEDAFERVGISEVVAYTAVDNLRSQAVMNRLRLHRDPSRDFTMDYDFGPWRGMVWVTR